MRLLDRYLLRELIVPLGYCLGGFLIFWISFDLLTQLESFQQHKLRGPDVAEYYFVKAPEFLVVVLPVALLLALLYTLTNHARHNELTAMRTAGVGLWRLSAPYFAVGFAASLVLFGLNEGCVPDSADAAEQILNRRTRPATAPRPRWHEKLAFENSRDERSWLLDFNPETLEMRNIHVDWRQRDGSRRVLAAERGVRTNGLWLFFNVQAHTEIPGSVFPVNRNLTNVLALPEFSETPEEIKSEIKINRQSGRGRVKRAEVPLPDLLDYLRLHPILPPAERRWIFTQLHGRLAAPWTCVVVVLIAIPFGAASGRRNVFVGVASSVFICFTFFILLQLGLALGTGGYLPPWFAAWFPNLAFGLTGAWLTARVR